VSAEDIKNLTFSQCVLHIFHRMKVLFFVSIPQFRKKNVTFVGRSPAQADPDFVGSQVYTILGGGGSLRKSTNTKLGTKVNIYLE
jgi:hypothetical protein